MKIYVDAYFAKNLGDDLFVNILTCFCFLLILIVDTVLLYFHIHRQLVAASRHGIM